MRADGLNLDLRFIEPFAIPVPTIHIPPEFVFPITSAFVCEHLLSLQDLFVIDNERACRMLIDAILIEVLKTDDSLFGFCEVQNDWEGPGLGYTGNVNYMLSSSRNKHIMESFLLIVQASKEWPDDAVAQVISKAGCLLRNNLAAGKKNNPVFAVLTNGLFYRFFAVDTDGIVYSSGVPLILGFGPEGDYTNSPSLSEILRWFSWFFASIASLSPRASSEDLTAAQVENSLDRLRRCFGLKNPISNKKVKT